MIENLSFFGVLQGQHSGSDSSSSCSDDGLPTTTAKQQPSCVPRLQLLTPSLTLPGKVCPQSLQHKHMPCRVAQLQLHQLCSGMHKWRPCLQMLLMLVGAWRCLTACQMRLQMRPLPVACRCHSLHQLNECSTRPWQTISSCHVYLAYVFPAWECPLQKQSCV